MSDNCRSKVPATRWLPMKAARSGLLLGLISFTTPALAESTAQADSIPATPCDNSAASPYDSQRKAPGVSYDALNTSVAVAQCAEAVSHYPNSGRLYFQLGRALEKANRIADAIVAYGRAAEIGHGGGFNNLGEMYRDGKGFARDPAKAEQYFQNGAALGYAEAQYNLAKLLLKKPRNDVDIAQVRQLLVAASGGGYVDARALLETLPPPLPTVGVQRQPSLDGAWAVGSEKACAASPYQLQTTDSVWKFTDWKGGTNVEKVVQSADGFYVTETVSSPEQRIGTRWEYRFQGPSRAEVRNVRTQRGFVIVRCPGPKQAAPLQVTAVPVSGAVPTDVATQRPSTDGPNAPASKADDLRKAMVSSNIQGVWALRCDEPASFNNQYLFLFSEPSGSAGFLYYYSVRQPSHFYQYNSIKELGDGRADITFSDGDQLLSEVLSVSETSFRPIEIKTIEGQYIVRDGKHEDTKEPTTTWTRCSHENIYDMAAQTSFLAARIQAAAAPSNMTQFSTCSVVNEYASNSDMGNDVRWEGECKDGLASGTGVQTWYKDGLVRYSRNYTLDNGRIKQRGKTGVILDVIDRAIRFTLASCDNSGTYRWIKGDITPSIAIDDPFVAEYVLDRAQKFAWKQCPEKSSGFGMANPVVVYSNVAVTIAVNGNAAIEARSYQKDRNAKESPSNLVWFEYRNIAREVRDNEYYEKFNAAANARAQQQLQQQQEAQRLALQRQEEAKERRLNAFTTQFHVEAWLQNTQLTANPFIFQGKTVGVYAFFRRMLSQNEGVFTQWDPRFDGADVLVVSNISPTAFQSPGQQAALAVRVNGMRTIDGRSYPDLTIIGIHYCGPNNCWDQ